MADPKVELRLYVVGESPNSILAIQNLRAICETYLNDQYRLEIVNVLDEPLRPLEDGVLITPTLIKLSPLPRSQVIGNLSDRAPLLLALGLEAELK